MSNMVINGLEYIQKASRDFHGCSLISNKPKISRNNTWRTSDELIINKTTKLIVII